LAGTPGELQADLARIIQGSVNNAGGRASRELATGLSALSLAPPFEPSKTARWRTL